MRKGPSMRSRLIGPSLQQTQYINQLPASLVTVSWSLCVIGSYQSGIMTVRYIYDNHSVKLVQVTTDAQIIKATLLYIIKLLEKLRETKKWSKSICLFFGVESATTHFSSLWISKAGLPPLGNKHTWQSHLHLYIICIVL